MSAVLDEALIKKLTVSTEKGTELYSVPFLYLSGLRGEYNFKPVAKGCLWIEEHP